MHGGQAIPAFDFYLAPYVRMSYVEELKALEDLNGESYKDLYEEPLMDYIKKPLDGLTGKERAQQHAINKTVGRVHQAMEAFIHNMNTIHSRGGNQVVFSSINYGTDTSAEGRCIMREILLSTYEGVGNGETAIFPIQIWKKKRGVNYLPEDRNFDLYQLACTPTTRTVSGVPTIRSGICMRWLRWVVVPVCLRTVSDLRPVSDVETCRSLRLIS